MLRWHEPALYGRKIYAMLLSHEAHGGPDYVCLGGGIIPPQGDEKGLECGIVSSRRQKMPAWSASFVELDNEAAEPRGFYCGLWVLSAGTGSKCGQSIDRSARCYTVTRFGWEIKRQRQSGLHAFARALL